MKEKDNIIIYSTTENDSILCHTKENGKVEKIYPDPKRIEHIKTSIKVVDEVIIDTKCNCKYSKKHNNPYCKHVMSLAIYKLGFNNVYHMIDLLNEYKKDIIEKRICY